MGKCPQCENDIDVINKFDKKCGFANMLVFTCCCSICKWTEYYYTSLPIEKKRKGLAK